MSVLNPAEQIVVNGRAFVPFLAAEEIADAVGKVAAQIDEQYRGNYPLCVCVMKGAMFFFTDLVRKLDFPVQVDFVRASSYGDAMTSSGTLSFTAEPGTEITGRNVIVVEDIIDTGRTARALREYFIGRGAETVEVASLLYKPEADTLGQTPEYVGFEIPDRFVVGYGLDYAEEGRNLPGIFVLADD